MVNFDRFGKSVVWGNVKRGRLVSHLALVGACSALLSIDRGGSLYSLNMNERDTTATGGTVATGLSLA